MSLFLKFDEVDNGQRKTRRFAVRAALGVEVHLGNVGYHPSWRRYVFYPQPETLFDPDCLRSIASFCESQTKLMRDAAAIRKAMGMNRASSDAKADLRYVDTVREAYNRWTGQQGIHGNRFPSWDELTAKEKANWVEDHIDV